MEHIKEKKKKKPTTTNKQTKTNKTNVIKCFKNGLKTPNHNPHREEEQTIQCPKENDKHLSCFMISCD